jgi:hypothetical protein
MFSVYSLCTGEYSAVWLTRKWAKWPTCRRGIYCGSKFPAGCLPGETLRRSERQEPFASWARRT